MKNTIFNLLVAAGILTSGAIQAEEKRQLDAHEHGVVTLNLAVEEQALFIELRSPAINIVGFEHAPSTAEQKEQISAEIARLEKGVDLFAIPPAAGCTLGEAHVELVREGDDHEAHDEHEEGHDEHDEAHEEHEEGHDEHDEAHDEHEEGHDEHDEEHAHEGESGEHSEFRAEYTYLCTDPNAIENINVNLFTLYPGIEEIVVAGAAAGGQMSQTLSPSSSDIVLP